MPARYRRTPLYRAAFGGHVDTVRFLLEEGADPRLHDSEGATPAEVAAAVVSPVLAGWDIARTDMLVDTVAARANSAYERQLCARQQTGSDLQIKVTDAHKRHEARQRELRTAYKE